MTEKVNFVKKLCVNAEQESAKFGRTLLKSGGVALSVISIGTFIIIFFIVGSKFDQTQREEIESVTQLITTAIEGADQAAITYEKLVALRMYSISKVIARQLHGRNLSGITTTELRRISDEWGLSDISLFVREGDDIIVGMSSDENEIGLSSKSWGYWYTAFQQLFEMRQVEVDEGFSINNFWAGPLTKSALYSEQFLYAYYYDGTTEFIINPYISAYEVQDFIDAYGPNRLIENTILRSSHIVEIAVLNVEAYLNTAQTEIVEPKKDLPVLYGKQSFSIPNDRSVLLEQKQKTISFSEDGVKYKKIYVPLSNHRMLTIVMDVSKLDQTLIQILGMMAIVFLAAYSIIYFITRNANARSTILIEKIRKLAYYDTLTGLPNRNHFREHFKSCIHDKTNFALFMIDLDNFKKINDTLGHDVGDRFLIEASNRLIKQLSGVGFLARMGGDEFTLILPIQTPRDAEDTAKGLLSCFQKPFLLEGQEFCVSLSIGISLYPVHGKDLDSLLKCADIALYNEKYKSKNNFSFFEFEMQDKDSELMDGEPSRYNSHLNENHLLKPTGKT